MVSGKWFKDGCADTVAYTAGCDPQPIPGETERPLTGVALTFSQGQRDQILGVADAGSGPDFAIRWTIRIPTDARLGFSIITAGEAALPVDVRKE